MAAHAILSASAAKKWLACPPSVRLELSQKHPNSDTGGVDAQTGTLAHALAELTLRFELGYMATNTFEREVEKIKANKLFTQDMPDYVEIYVQSCINRFNKAKAKTPDARAMIEMSVSLKSWVPEGFGTADFVVIADDEMEVIDFKYGVGVAVDALDNPQLKLYALGALVAYDWLYDIKKVKMTIIQPRKNSQSSDELSAEDLLEWAANVLKPTAALAYKGEGQFEAGDHCLWCKAKYECSCRAAKNKELAKYDFSNPALLDPEEIADILSKVDEMMKWGKDIQEYALKAAMQGKIFPGFKLVEGCSNRKFVDEQRVAEILFGQGYSDEVIYTKKLTGITTLESAMGKKQVTNLLGKFIEKPPGKPVLVPESDKRKVFKSADADFGKIDEGESIL